MLRMLFTLVIARFRVLLSTGDADLWRLRYLCKEKECQILKRTLVQKNLRVQFTQADRLFFSLFAPLRKLFAETFMIVQSETVLRWYRNFLKLRWIHPRKKPGRRRISQKIKDLVLSIKKLNRFFGLTRIQGELAKVEVDLGRTSIQRILHQGRKDGTLPPLGSWRKFLQAHWNSLFACDFLTVNGIFGKRWFVFFLIKLNTRQIVQWGVTEHPNHTFVQQQMIAFAENNPGPRDLIHDHGPELFHFPYQDYGITNHLTAIASPNLNAYAERFVRSIHRECLDHFIVGHQKQLRTILGQYIDYYNDRRPHQGIGNTIPSGQPPGGCGEIRSRPILFGLYRDFYRSVC